MIANSNGEASRHKGCVVCCAVSAMTDNRGKI